MLNFLSQSKPAFGLCISASSVKLMQLDKKGDGFSVRAYSHVPAPKGLINNDTVTDAKTFEYIMKQAMEKCQIGQLNTNYAVINLPEAKSFVRVIQIPLMSDSEADNAVPVEAESFIPLPVDQVYLDWQKLGQSADKMDVLIVATPRDFVDQYLSVLDGIGVKPAVLEVESQSCVRAVFPPGSQDTALVVDLDAYRSSLIMVEDGNLQFTSTVPIAGNNFTESIAQILGVAAAKAEEIKLKVGIANTADYPNIKTALLPPLNSLVAEIKSILHFHREHSQKDVKRIILAGGSAKLRNLPEFLAPQFEEFPGLTVELSNPWLGLPGLGKPPFDQYEALGFTTTIGLAMRGVNFTP